MKRVTQIAPCLWFDGRAEEAAAFYTAIFPNSRIVQVARYGEAGREFHRQPVGAVMTVAFELDGQLFTALNGGPLFKFTEAISFQVMCETQEEVDHYWEKVGAGGDPTAQQCGWLKDKFGVSWQVVPRAMTDLLGDGTSAAGQRVMAAVMQMKKLDLAAIRKAHAG
ncbi:MAG TPA: VOC family protein [Gemmataceae bacterium]|jgi:predicted 3-demethylubiquinone-9 3-methyltransferase (glyoxalase superfamily)|nr:VOC family protein [Gemmataceae bacterium]